MRRLLSSEVPSGVSELHRSARQVSDQTSQSTVENRFIALRSALSPHMSFRRDSSRDRKWKLWIGRHRDELLACGMPLMVMEDEQAWLYFLDHGYFAAPGIAEALVSVKMLPEPEARHLWEFLERNDYYPDCPTVRELRYRFTKKIED